MRNIFGFIAAALLIGTAVSCDGGHDNGTSTPTPFLTSEPTNAGSGEAAHPAATSNPTPAPWVRPPRWVPGDPASPAGDDSQFVIDIRSGEIWELLAAEPDASSPTRAQLIAWSPEGDAVVAVVAPGKALLYTARPGEAFRYLMTTSGESPSISWSPDGLLLEAEGRIIDPATNQLVTELPGTAIGWSADSRFLATAAGSSVIVWDRDTGQLEQRRTGGGVWSSEGSRFAYQPVRQPATQPRENQIRITDLSGGRDVAISIQSLSASPVAWSRDDRFIAALVTQPPEEGTSAAYSYQTQILDTTLQRSVVIADGSWANAWVRDRNTLLLTGNVCSTFDIFTVNADGSGLRNYTSSPEAEVEPALAPASERVAFVARAEDEETAVYLLSLVDGTIAELVSAPSLSFPAWASLANSWSPDGQYLVFGVGGGRGICEGAAPQTTAIEVLP